MMTSVDLATLLSLGYEQQGIEFKGPGLLSDSHLRAKVIRAMLGMANRRDGGYVVVGIGESASFPDPIGLTSDELASWRYDDLATHVSNYADPILTFDREEVEYEGKTFLMLRVHEFEEIPILCKRDFQITGATGEPVLRRGACYVRSRRKPETSEIPSHEDMRALLDLAIQKGVRGYITLSSRVGVDLGDVGTAGHEKRFTQERGAKRIPDRTCP